MMKLIEDLGTVYPKPTSKYPAKMGIYECNECKKHVKCYTAYVERTNRELCEPCGNKLKVSEFKEAKQEDFKMKIIKDLGRVYKNPTDLHKKHLVVLECSKCNTHITCSAVSNQVKKQEYCLMCSNSYNNLKHGDHKTRLYKIWGGMKRRCYGSDPKDIDYKLKGVTVCLEWIDNYEAFKEWSLDNGYADNLSIDRENNDLGYSTSNCRWTTKTVQSRNTKILRKDNSTGYRGVSKCNKGGMYRARITVDNKQILIGTFLTPEEAAYVYDKFVIDNGLEHTTNGLYIKGE